MENEEIRDLLHSIKNRCIIAEWILNQDAIPKSVMQALVTLYEDSGEGIQKIVIDHCLT